MVVSGLADKLFGQDRSGGLRGCLDCGDANIALVNSGVLNATDFPRLAEHDPRRSTAMIDFSPSEFSRFRLQFAHDEARFNESDNEIFLQYIMSLGTHGAHKF